MKKILGIIIIVIVAMIMWFVGINNKLVGLKEEVNTKSANIDSALKRRSDLIPNLVATVKGYTKHESNIIKSVTDARAALVGAKNTADKAKAASQLDGALNRLLVVVENYPDLKANSNFQNLQDELAGTENRINVARTDYNEIVKKYNKVVLSFPSSIVASIRNFKKAAYFEVSGEDKKVPSVKFDE